MEGIFLRKKFNIWLFLMLLCGLAFIGMYIFLNIVDPAATNELLTFLIMGILIILVVIPSWLLNFGAFVRIDEDSVKAKYHWFGKIDCKLSDVTYAAARSNTLIIQLKDGKTHTIMGIGNPWPLASILRRNMHFDVTEQPETLKERLNDLKATKKNGLIYVCSGVAFMFLIILLAVFLTGEREMYEFSNTDWTIFAIMCAAEVATVIATFYFAQKTGKNNVPMEKLQYEIRRRIVETYPVLPGRVIKILTDDYCSGRITVFGHPNDDTVYYTIQTVTPDYTLIQTYESETFENAEQLSIEDEELIDITETVLY